MPRYLSAETIQGAVQRLGESRAQSRLTEYLIVRRALRLGGSKQTVTLSQRDAYFMTALREFTAISSDTTTEPFFSPFGWSRDSKSRGYRSRKYESNGPSNTVMDWHGKPNSPIERVPETRPAQVRLAERTPVQLTEFLYLSGADAGPKPRAIDVAYWWLRGTDIEGRFGDDPTETALVAAMLDDFGLHEDESLEFFESEVQNSDGEQ